MVVGVGMEVEEGVPAGFPQRVERARVTPLADVGDALERSQGRR